MKKVEDMEGFDNIPDAGKALLKMLFPDENEKVKYSLSNDTEYKLWQAGYTKQEETEDKYQAFRSKDIDIVNLNDGYVKIIYRQSNLRRVIDEIATKRMEIKDLTFEAIVAMIEKLKAL